MIFLGVDLAWGQGTQQRPANETGVACIDESGAVVDAGWTRGLNETVSWIVATAAAPDCLLAVDAPLVVDNPSRQRVCEKQVGQRYGKWQVSANTTNLGSPRLAGVALLTALVGAGWAYSDGHTGPPKGGRNVFECYPYTTLVGAAELGYDDERPRYKRKPKALRTAEWRPLRAAACDDLVTRMSTLAGADPPLHLRSHEVAETLLDGPSPLLEAAYKHREDLIDALLCAWTASLWSRHGHERCQVLGDEGSATRAAPTIIAPARPEQRRPVGGAATVTKPTAASRAKTPARAPAPTATPAPAPTATPAPAHTATPAPAPASCQCGCGQPTVSARARYRAGHDARHAGEVGRRLVAEAKAGAAPTTRAALAAEFQGSLKLADKAIRFAAARREEP